MAVNVNIPGIGNVEANGMAEEATLRQLVLLMGQSINKTRRVDSELTSLFKRQDAAADDTTQSMNEMASSARMAGTSTTAYYNSLRDIMSSVGSGISDLGGYAGSFGRDLLATSASITKNWTGLNPSTITDPISATSGVLNGIIGVVTGSFSLLASSTGAVAKVMGSDIIARAIAGTGTGIAKATETVLVALNNKMATELANSVKAMHDFAQMGGNFGDGILTIRNLAGEANLNLEQFSGILKASRENISAFGMGLGGGAMKLSALMATMDSESSKDSKINRKFRDELTALGYGVEEQAAVTASYVANLRAGVSLEAFNNISRKELAEGTRKYAGDLKILAEFTGKDAKALMEKARAESMRGALLSKLDDNQRKSFIDSSAALNQFPDDIKNNIQTALMQQLAGGTITDPLIAGNARAMEYVQDLATKIKSGNTNMVDYTIKQGNELRERTLEYQKATGGQESLVNLFGAGGLGASLGKFNDALGAMKPLDPKAIEQSRVELDKMRESTSTTTKGFINATKAAQDFSTFIGKLATDVLPAYTKLIGDTATMSARIMALGGQAIKGEPIKPEAVGRLVRDALNNVQRNAKGGIVEGSQLSWVGEAGKEAIIPLANGSVPVEISGLKNMIDPSAALSERKNQESSASASQTSQLSKAIEQLPETVGTVLQTLLSGSNGFASVMMDVKNQLASDNREQMSVLQEQVEKMTSIVTVMEDNIRASERIANALG